MTHLLMLPLLLVVLVALVNASSLLENGLIFEDIRIENVDSAVSKKSAPFVRSRRSAHSPFLQANDPTFAPTMAPTTPDQLSFPPTFEPSFNPTENPTENPTQEPTMAPTDAPTMAPTEAPTMAPTNAPTMAPTNAPTYMPTYEPTFQPTYSPTQTPTYSPSATPTVTPTFTPTATPTFTPTAVPSFTPMPTSVQPNVMVYVNGELVANNVTVNAVNGNAVIRSVLAKSIDKVTKSPPGSTTIGTARSATTTRRQLVAVTDAVIIPYTIVIPSLYETTYPNAESAYAIITALIQQSTTSNNLTLTMQQIAEEEGVLLLFNTTIGAVIPLGYETADPPSNHMRYVNDGEIAGIIVGSIVGIALLGVLLYYLLRMRRTSLGETAGSDNGDKAAVYRDLGNDDVPAIMDGSANENNNNNAVNNNNDTSLVLASDNDTRV